MTTSSGPGLQSRAQSRLPNQSRTRRTGTVSTAVLLVLAIVFTWFATRAEGETVSRTELNDGGVWVTTSAQSRFGRINKPAGQLDAAVAATAAENTGLDILQDGAAVLGVTKATNQATPINVRTGQLVDSSVLTLPSPAAAKPAGDAGNTANPANSTNTVAPGPAVVDLRGGTLAVVDPATGKVRAQRVDPAMGITTLDKVAGTGPPLATIGAGATVAVSVDGTVYAVSASSGQLAVISPLAGGGFADAKVKELGFSASSVQLTVVGDRWVIFDPTTGLIRADGLGAPIDLAQKLGAAATGTGGAKAATAYGALQAPGPDSDAVAIATPRGVSLLPFGTDPSQTGEILLPGAATGAKLWVAPPVRIGRCVHGAWASADKLFYGRSCTEHPAEAVVIEAPAPGVRVDGVRLRTNRGLVALNDLDTGAVWDVDSDAPIKIDDWPSVIPPPKSGNDNTKPDPNQLDNEVVRRPPEAKPDDVKVRPGRTSTLHVLDNDSDSLGAVLAIGPGDVSTPDVPGILVSPSIDGQNISISVPDKPIANVVHFSYTVNNGQPGAEGRSTALVTATIVDESVNTAPYVRTNQATIATAKTPVIRGGHVSVGVKADWRDAENDPVVIESLDQSASVDGGGALAITAPNQPGPVDVKYKVEDGRGGSTEAKASVIVLGDADRPVPPVAQADVIRAVVGKPVQLQPLGNDLPGADPTDPTARLRLAAEVRGPAGLMIDTNVETGVVTITGSAPGSHLLTYAAQVGSAVGAGRFRVDILPAPTDDAPPVAAPDAATVRDQSPAITDVLANDYSPRSDVLVIQSVATTEPWVRAWVVQGRWLRVQALAPLQVGQTERRGVVNYTINDGTRSATGELSVVQKPAPPAALMPTIVDDQATVRWGDVVTIPALDNDSMADGVPLKFTAGTIKVVVGKGQVYASGQVLRYLPDPDPITVEKVVTLEYAAYPEGMPERSVTGRVTVTVKPPPTPQTPDQPPTARNFSASVPAGEAIPLTVPTSGIDPDGDLAFVSGIVGEAGGPVNLKLGRVTAYGASTIRYESYPGSAGTEVLRYAVADCYGKSGEGLIRIGVVQPGSPQPPVAMPDDVTAAPGRQVTVDVLANDLIPRNADVVVEDPATTNSPEVLAQFTREGEQSFKVAAPEEGPSKVLVYGINGGLFDPSRTTLTVRGRKGYNNPPVAADDVARVAPAPAAAGAPGAGGAGGAGGAPTVGPAPAATASNSALVDVLENDRDIDGDHNALKVVEVGEGASIEKDGVRVSFADYPRAVPYIVEDADGGRAMALIYVPASGSDVPYVIASKPITMDKDATITVPLADHITDPRGRAVRLTTPDTLSASPADRLAVKAVSATELQLTASGGYVGPAAIMLEVTDSTGPDDQAPRTAYLVVPVQVGPLQPLLRCPQWEINVVADAPGRTIDIPRLCSAWFPEGLDPASVEYSATWDAAIDNVTMRQQGQGGRQVLVTAAADALHGAKGSFFVSVAGAAEKFALRVRVTSLRADPAAAAAAAAGVEVPPPPPLAVLRPARVEGLYAGQSQVVNLAQYLDSPFGTLHCDIVAVRVVTDGGVTASQQGCILTVTASRNATGVTQFAVDVSDAPDRISTGTVTVSVRARPTPPQSVDAVADRIQGGSARVSWLPPAFDGGLPILGYEVGWSGGSASCEASPCTITGLTNGVDYFFTVRARNAVDWSDSGGPSRAARPDTAPEAVSVGAVTPSDRTLAISWTAPVNAGSAVDSYNVQLLPIDGGSSGGLYPVTGGGTSTSVSGLNNNSEYLIRVQAHNEAGWGPYGPSRTAQPVGTPSRVVVNDLVLSTPSPSDDTATVQISWQPADPNGPPMSSYAVFRAVGDGAMTRIATVSPGGSLITSDVVPYDGLVRRYAVTATNGGGVESPMSDARSFEAVGVPETPRAPSVSTPAADLQMAVSFALGAPHALRWTYVEWTSTAGGSGQIPCSSSDCSYSGSIGNSDISEQRLSIRGCVLNGPCSAWSAQSAVFQPYGPTKPVVALEPSMSGPRGKYDVTFSWKLVTNGRPVTVAVSGAAAANCKLSADNASCTVRNVGYDTTVAIAVTAQSIAGDAAAVPMSFKTPAKADPVIRLSASGSCIGLLCGVQDPPCAIDNTCRYITVTSSLWDASSMTCTFTSPSGTIGDPVTIDTNTTVRTDVFYGDQTTVTGKCENTTTNETATTTFTWP